MGILNRRLSSEMQYHDTLHGFRTGRGIGTASLEAKLIQQLTAMREEFLCEPMLPWTRVDASTSLQHMAWDHRCLISSDDTGIVSLWSHGTADIWDAL